MLMVQSKEVMAKRRVVNTGAVSSHLRGSAICLKTVHLASRLSKKTARGRLVLRLDSVEVTTVELPRSVTRKLPNFNYRKHADADKSSKPISRGESANRGSSHSSIMIDEV